MSIDENQPLMTDEEFGAALADITAQGLVEWCSDEELRLTDKGISRAFELKEKMGNTNWLIITLLHERIREVTVNEHPSDP